MMARRAIRVTFALVAAGIAWVVAGLAGPVLGSDALWPLDRMGAVLAALAGVEAVLRREADAAAHNDPAAAP
jgi:hypothetical protein